MLGAIAQGFAQRIAVTHVECGQAWSQKIVVPRTVVDAPTAPPLCSRRPAARVQAECHRQGPRCGHPPIETNEFDGYGKSLISGDSAYRCGGMPMRRRAAPAGGIVINGLHLLPSQGISGRLVGYDAKAAFADLIIGGAQTWCGHVPMIARASPGGNNTGRGEGVGGSGRVNAYSPFTVERCARRSRAQPLFRV